MPKLGFGCTKLFWEKIIGFLLRCLGLLAVCLELLGVLHRIANAYLVLAGDQNAPYIIFPVNSRIDVNRRCKPGETCKAGS